MSGFDEREHLAALRRAFVRGYQLAYFTGMVHGRHGHIDPTPPSGYYEDLEITDDKEEAVLGVKEGFV